MINKKHGNSTTPPPAPTSTDMPDLEWTLTEEPQNLSESEIEDWERVPRPTTTEEMERSIRRAPTKQGREEEWNPTLKGIFRKRAASPTTCQDEVPKQVKFQGPPPPPPASPILSSTPSSSFPPPSRPSHQNVEVAAWSNNRQLTQDYQREILADPCWSNTFKEAHTPKNPLTKIIEGFLYINKHGSWKFVILRGLKIGTLSAQEALIQQGHQNTGHGGLQKTYEELNQYYRW